MNKNYMVGFFSFVLLLGIAMFSSEAFAVSSDCECGVFSCTGGKGCSSMESPRNYYCLPEGKVNPNGSPWSPPTFMGCCQNRDVITGKRYLVARTYATAQFLCDTTQATKDGVKNAHCVCKYFDCSSNRCSSSSSSSSSSSGSSSSDKSKF